MGAKRAEQRQLGNMSRKNNTLRIDELLLKQGLVTEDQVRAALDYQREHGGRLGSHFMRLGYITEQQLLDWFKQASQLPGERM